MQTQSPFLLKAFENSKDGMLILKQDKILLCNYKAQRMLNINKAYRNTSIYNYSTNVKQVKGRRIDFDKIVFDDIVNGNKTDLEWEFQRKNGARFYLAIEIRTLPEANNDFRLVTLKDITDQKQFNLMLNARLVLLKESSGYDLPSLYKKTLEEVVLLTESENGIFLSRNGLLNRYEVEAVVNDSLNEELAEGKVSNVLHQYLEQVLSTQEAVIHNKIENTNNISIWNDSVSKELLVPIIRERLLVGVVALSNKATCYTRLDEKMTFTLLDLTWDLAEKKKAELALRERENLFQRVFKRTSLGMILSTPDGHILESNSAICKLLEYSSEELSNVNLFDLFHPDSQFETIKIKQLENDELFDIYEEKIIIDKWQDIKWVNVSINLQKNNEGKSTIICLLEDITEKKKTLFQLQKSEERFKLLSSIAKEGVCIHDNGVIIDANSALADIFGVDDIEKFLGQNFLQNDMLPAESKRKLRQVFLSRKDEMYDIKASRADGTPIDLEITGRNFFYKGRNIRLGTVRDITDRKKSELALMRSERNFREFFNNTVISLFVFDETGRILKVNEHACKMLKYSEEELLQRKITDLHPVEERENVFEKFDLIVQGIQKNCTIPFQSKNGISIPISTHIGHGNWNGQPALFCVGRDLTELKKSEEKFNKAFQKNGMAMIIANYSDFTVVEANNKALQVLGYTFDEIKNRNDIFLNIPCDIKRRDELMWLADNEDVNDYYYQFYTKSKEILTTSVNIANIQLQEKKFYLVSFIDVTDKIKIEKALKDSETRLKEITENVQEGIILANMNYQYAFVNNTFCEMTGYSREELLQMKINQLVVNPDDFNMAKKLATSGGAVTGKYIPMKKKNGNVFYINVSAKRINIGQESFILGTQKDVTSEYKSEQELLKAYDEIKSLKVQLEHENLILKEEIKKNHSFSEIITQNDVFRETLNQIEVVARTNASVLIKGETGTGKELVARAIHEKSSRSTMALVKLNCAAIPSTLIESELFGHEKGAFTGAINQKVGRFEIANGGTLFLDEIGEMPVDLQSKLLRVLQEGEFERLGGHQTIKVDVRIIAATNRDLQKEIDAGNFRLDLFYRLNVFPVSIPPLRDRIDDISLLTQHFVAKFNEKLNKKITKLPVKAMNELKSYKWPGNVRELENRIERAMILSNGNTLKIDFLYDSKEKLLSNSFLSFEEMQKKYIQDVLDHTNWKISGKNGATEILGLKYSTLVSKMQKLGIKNPKNDD